MLRADDRYNDTADIELLCAVEEQLFEAWPGKDDVEWDSCWLMMKRENTSLLDKVFVDTRHQRKSGGTELVYEIATMHGSKLDSHVDVFAQARSTVSYSSLRAEQVPTEPTLRKLDG